MFSEFLSDLQCEAEKEVMILEGGQTLQGDGSWLPGPSAVHCFLLLMMVLRYRRPGISDDEEYVIQM